MTSKMVTTENSEIEKLDDASGESGSSPLKSTLITAILLAGIVSATILAYQPVLFDFFLGDDFVHLTWLKDAVHTPEMVWRNFHSSWLDGTTTKFYRPLISVFMVSDYMVWGANGLGFHLTNLLFHLVATVAIFFISGELLMATRRTGSVSVDQPDKMPWLYCVAAALAFGLYPLHAEAVSWITGRVDSVVTAFYTCSFLMYLKWRRQDAAMRPLWLTGCIVAMILGLLSKEMAVTLPPLFVIYELIFGKSIAIDLKNPMKMVKSTFEAGLAALRVTAPFWLLLVAYFGLRRYALGTFVGGYDDSLFFIADIKHFLLSWLHGLRMFLIPLNKNLMGAHHIITRGWEIHLALVAALVVLNLYFERRLARLFLFNSIFLCLALAPVYKIFAISDDLQGSRLAHVATVALALLVAMAFIVPRREDKSQSKSGNVSGVLSSTALRAVTACTYSLVLGLALWTNNQAWARAGHEANDIRRGLDVLYKNIKGDPQVLLVGLPDQIDGAYISRNALWGMTKVPQLHRDVWNCLMLNQYEQILPFGHFKQTLQSNPDKVQIYFWDKKKAEFSPLPLKERETASLQLSGPALADAITVDKAADKKWNTDGSLEVSGDMSRFGKPELIIDLGKKACFDVDFIKLAISDLGSDPALLQQEGADLLYTNDLKREFNLPDRTHADFRENEKEQNVVLPLRSLPEWALGGDSKKLKLRLPRGSRLRINSLSVIPAEEAIPRVDFENSGFFGSKGFIHLGDDNRSEKLTATSSKLDGAAGVVLEITRPNLCFEFQNTIRPSNVTMVELPFDSSGELVIERKQFPALGMYEARPWAVDKNGKKLGICGDHIVISVDS